MPLSQEAVIARMETILSTLGDLWGNRANRKINLPFGGTLRLSASQNAAIVACDSDMEDAIANWQCLHELIITKSDSRWSTFFKSEDAAREVLKRSHLVRL